MSDSTSDVGPCPSEVNHNISEPESAPKKKKEDAENQSCCGTLSANKENSTEAVDSVEESTSGGTGDKADSEPKETVEVIIVFKGTKHKIEVDLDSTVTDFKHVVHSLTGVPPSLQKLIYKVAFKDDELMRSCKLTRGCKIMLIGSSLDDVIAVNKPPPKGETSSGSSAALEKREPLSKQKPHTKVLEKGIPDDALPGIKNIKEVLPFEPLAGMRNSRNQKVRLTFKLELDQLWIGTPERTEKITMNQIASITSEPISGHEEYHMIGFQLGTTELSRYWVYWVPAQYVDAIKRTIQG